MPGHPCYRRRKHAVAAIRERVRREAAAVRCECGAADGLENVVVRRAGKLLGTVLCPACRSKSDIIA